VAKRAYEFRGDAKTIFFEGENKKRLEKSDLQPVAQALCPEIQAAISWLESQGLQARMTGSGSAVFAHCPEGTPPLQAPNHWTHRRCSILEVHPLWEWASSDD